VARDARALLAEWFLGDLHDDVLASLQHFRNQLRPARRSVSPVMPAMRAMSAAPLEASAAAIRTAISATVTVAAAMGTIRAPIRASAASTKTAAISAAVASAALRALEAGTRIGADTCKILARRVRIARAAGLSRQKHSVIFSNGFHG
jgi:hypothetical protein